VLQQRFQLLQRQLLLGRCAATVDHEEQRCALGVVVRPQRQHLPAHLAAAQLAAAAAGHLSAGSRPVIICMQPSSPSAVSCAALAGGRE
jgi:hypothetical protein